MLRVRVTSKGKGAALLLLSMLAPKRKDGVLYGMLCHKIAPEPRVITLVGDPSGGITGNRRIEPAKCLPKDAARANVRCCATTGSGAEVSTLMKDYGCSGNCAACKGPPTIDGQAWPNEHPGHTYDTAKQFSYNYRLSAAARARIRNDKAEQSSDS
eukprot:g10259.t1